MDISMNLAVSSLVLVTIITCVWRVVNWVWLRPKMLEKHLRQQGLVGNSYRLLYGDLKEFSTMVKQANSTPIPLTHHISPRVDPFFHKVVTHYGKNSFIWLGPTPRVTIMEPDQIKDIFTKIYDFQKPHTNPIFRSLAKGLLKYEGEKWAKHRKIINHAFNLEKLKEMIPTFFKSCDEMISEWEELVYKKGSSELDVWPYLKSLTADVISRIAFGSNYKDERRIFQLQEELVENLLQVVQFDYIPGWRFLPTKKNRRLKEIDKEIQSSLMGMIKRKEKAMRAGEAANDDLLGILMESNFKEIEKNKNNKDSGMSLQDVIEECKSFYFAGQVIISNLLVWTMVLLSKHQDWQARARDEVVQIFRDKKPDFDGLNHLKIVQMILYEVLRLYPPITLLGRTIDKEMRLGNLLLPAGVEVSLSILLVHHDRKLWGDDATAFKPERFAGGVSKATRNQVSFIPFGWGPRVCIGQKFALTEVKMALVMILQKFTFELSPSYAHAPHAPITLQPQLGAHLILQKP